LPTEVLNVSEKQESQPQLILINSRSQGKNQQGFE
jgi:hypothetical protein